MKTDRIVVVCAVLLAAVYFYATEQIPTLQIGDPMGAKAIPRLLGIALLVSAGLLWLESRLATKNMELTNIQPTPDWLTVNKDQFTGTMARIPTREEIAPIVNEQLIVELYSKA